MTELPANVTNKASFYALAIIIDELKSEDTQVRLNGINKIPTVALAIGPERTRNELLPFLREATYDEDEILLSLAKQMGDFLTYVGGKTYASHLIPILDNIMSVEEAICRDEAVKSTLKLISIMTSEEIFASIIPTIENAVNSEFFTRKTSACYLLAPVYSRLEDSYAKEKIREFFKKMCFDNTSIVRRAAAVKMSEILLVVEHENIEGGIEDGFFSLLGDDQDSVRVPALDSLVEIMKISDDARKASLLISLENLFTDKSWRIRYKIAELSPDLLSIVGEEFGTKKLLPAFVSFLRDDEAEVKTSSSHKIPEFCENLSPEIVSNVILTNFLPCIKNLIEDSNVNVKNAIASVVLRMCRFLNKENMIEYILPLFKIMLRDSCPEVRLNVLSNLGNTKQMTGCEELCSALLPTIIELAEDIKWRVRLAVVQFLPLLSSQLGKELFNVRLTNLCLELLLDDVYAIREQVSIVLCNLVNDFGVEWGLEFVLPRLKEISNDVSYLKRLTAMFTINKYMDTNPNSEFAKHLYEIPMLMIHDKVPNVRFNAAKTIGLLSNYTDRRIIEEQIKPHLNQLRTDDDIDVQFYAEKAIDHIA